MTSPFSAIQQPRSVVGTKALRQDQDPNKNNSTRNDLVQDQRLAVAGETIPIVFCKRESFFNGAFFIGGAWIAPAMIRDACDYLFDDPALNDGQLVFSGDNPGNFVVGSVFAASQGELVSTPTLDNIYIGENALQTLTARFGTTPQVIKEYKSGTFMEANPTFCPLPSFVECNTKYMTWYAGELTTEKGFDIKSRGPNIQGFTINIFVRRLNSVSTDNTRLELPFDFFDAVTGDLVSGGGSVINFIRPCQTTNTTMRAGKVSITNWPFRTANQNTSGQYIIRLAPYIINTQSDPGDPADPAGVEFEVYVAGSQFDHVFTVAPPPAVETKAFSDITVLTIEGNVFNEEDKQYQSYFYVNEGVKVDLYSQGPTAPNVFSTGASNQFVDLACYLFKIFDDLQPGTASTLGAKIDVTNLPSIASFCAEYLLFCNGVVSQPVNLVDYISQTSRLFLLSFVSSGGQYKFRTLLPVSQDQLNDGALTPAAIFNESQILPGSFKKDYVSIEERKPFFANMVFNEILDGTVNRQQTIQVGYPSTALDAPIEQFDMTDVCADGFHAYVIAVHELARRKNTTHTVTFDVDVSSALLDVTDVVQVQLPRISSKGDNRIETETYQITDIVVNTDGTASISAVHFPLDEQDKSVIIQDMLNVLFDVM